MMGDLFNVLLAPTHIMEALTNVANPNEYIKAQRDGRVYDNCSAYQKGCPYSFFEVNELCRPELMFSFLCDRRKVNGTYVSHISNH